MGFYFDKPLDDAGFQRPRVNASRVIKIKNTRTAETIAVSRIERLKVILKPPK
jgi:hypothetical protein